MTCTLYANSEKKNPPHWKSRTAGVVHKGMWLTRAVPKLPPGHSWPAACCCFLDMSSSLQLNSCFSSFCCSPSHQPDKIFTVREPERTCLLYEAFMLPSNTSSVLPETPASLKPFRSAESIPGCSEMRSVAAATLPFSNFGRKIPPLFASFANVKRVSPATTHF